MDYVIDYSNLIQIEKYKVNPIYAFIKNDDIFYPQQTDFEEKSQSELFSKIAHEKHFDAVWKYPIYLASPNGFYETYHVIQLDSKNCVYLYILVQQNTDTQDSPICKKVILQPCELPYRITVNTRCFNAKSAKDILSEVKVPHFIDVYLKTNFAFRLNLKQSVDVLRLHVFQKIKDKINNQTREFKEDVIVCAEPNSDIASCISDIVFYSHEIVLLNFTISYWCRIALDNFYTSQRFTQTIFETLGQLLISEVDSYIDEYAYPRLLEILNNPHGGDISMYAFGTEWAIQWGLFQNIFVQNITKIFSGFCLEQFIRYFPLQTMFFRSTLYSECFFRYYKKVVLPIVPLFLHKLLLPCIQKHRDMFLQHLLQISFLQDQQNQKKQQIEFCIFMHDKTMKEIQQIHILSNIDRIYNLLGAPYTVYLFDPTSTTYRFLNEKEETQKFAFYDQVEFTLPHPIDGKDKVSSPYASFTHMPIIEHSVLYYKYQSRTLLKNAYSFAEYLSLVENILVFELHWMKHFFGDIHNHQISAILAIKENFYQYFLVNDINNNRCGSIQDIFLSYFKQREMEHLKRLFDLYAHPNLLHPCVVILDSEKKHEQSETPCGFVERFGKIYESYLSQQFEAICKNYTTDTIQKAEEEIKRENNSPINQVETSLNLINALATECDLHYQFIQYCFTGCPHMSQVFTRCYEKIMNDKQLDIVHKLPVCMDFYLRKSNTKKVKSQTPIEFKQWIEKVELFVLPYIHDKDIVHSEHLHLTSQRFINHSSISKEYEELVIGLLQKQGVTEWTNSLNIMLQDLSLFEQLKQSFSLIRQQQQTQTLRNKEPDFVNEKEDKHDFHFEAFVVTSKAWSNVSSTHSKPLFHIPLETQSSCDSFHRHYQSLYPSRKLEFLYQHGEAELSFDFGGDNQKIFVCSTAQMCVLLLFQQHSVLTYQNILDYTGIPHEYLINPLLSLCHPRCKLLLKEPNTKNWDLTHSFEINTLFQHPLKKVVLFTKDIVKPSQLLLPLENVERNKNIEKSRNCQIDAQIVKFMKTKKEIRCNLLIAHTMQYFNHLFQPSAAQVKDRIEILIEQEFLERKANDRSIILYKA